MIEALWPPNPKLLLMAILHLPLSWLIRRVIQIAIGIGRLQVDRWRNHMVQQRLHGDHQFDASAGSESMSQLALGTGNADRPGMVLKDMLDGQGFGFIPQRRAGSVSVDIVDIGGLQSSVLQSV